MRIPLCVPSIPLLCLLLSLPVQAAVDLKLGKQLHDKQCVACHVKLMGGDGSRMYTRKPRLINDAVALGKRVAACSAQTDAPWLPEDEENVAAWLNKTYYKFK